ncbi:MAG: hypothetical protein PVF37_09665 [Desulfobacterales bacterium]|jgi:hypothetical protein
MKFYFLTDESEKSLAPFFSKPVLDAVMASAVIVGAVLVVFWTHRPLSDLILTGSEPKFFFLIFATALVVNSYVNLCCGGGSLVRKGYHMINYPTDTVTHEKEINFFGYGLIEFLLHAILLLLPLLPLLSLAVFSSALSMITFMAAIFVLYTTALFCRMSGFLVYLLWGRSSTLGYFVGRVIMIFFVFATALFAPAINPLQLLYRLNHSPQNLGYPLAIYLAVVLPAVGFLILVSNALVRRHISKNRHSKGLDPGDCVNSQNLDHSREG